MRKLWNRLSGILTDSSRSFEERIFVLLTIIALSGVTVALIGDIVTGENMVEIILLAVTDIVVPITVSLSVKTQRVKIGARLIMIALVFIIIPSVVFFGGGIRGGGILWIIFSYLYIGLVLTGTWRTVMLILLTVLTVLEYAVCYYFPKLVYQHSEEMAHIDSLASVIMVGLVCFVMVMFQNRMFRNESIRAQEEAQRAEELNRSQNRFFSSMSHEIRTPINTILGLNEIILRQEDASEEIIKDSRNIQGAGKMLLALVNDILDVSRIEAGRMEIVPVEYRVGDLVSEIVNMVWLHAQEKGLEFNVDIDPSTPSVLFGDEMRIKQMLVNLLNNAVKYTERGSVSLHMECEEVTEGSVLLKVTVADTGIGIRKEALPYLFDAFLRMDEEKNRFIEGTGLGLSIVKQLCDLMGGKISVNSVYTQGSTFALEVQQGIVGTERIGELDITGSSGHYTVTHYEHRFHAPGAQILIVDDNELNLEVEAKLLLGTDLGVDCVKSGKEALVKTLHYQYDLILMDHLMPEMDGIECLTRIRRQTGGLNREVPVIVLTANAGSENRERYNAAGFDGYLLKPVSGEQLEEMLLRHLSDEKVQMSAGEKMSHQKMNTGSGYARKQPVLITTSTLCDLPDEVIKEMQLDMIPFAIKTKEGVFFDGVEMVGSELIRYINETGNAAVSDPLTVDDYMAFFSEKLKKAHHLIHIATASCMSEEYRIASEAAGTFENVTVVDSAVLSSSMGLLVMLAYRMASQNESPERIVKELERMKEKIHCSFVLADTGYMTGSGYLSERTNMILKTLWLRPCMKIKNNVFSTGRILMGSRINCYRQYISYALPRKAHPDKELLFVTYVDVPEQELLYIEEEIRKRFDFDRIIFQKAAAAISAKCGPGTFGLLYMDRDEHAYRLGTLFTDAENAEELPLSDKTKEPQEQNKTPWESADQNDAQRLYEAAGIDRGEGIKNSGSEEAYRSVLEIFYESIAEGAEEIEQYYRNEDWKNYTVKVHALKSSAKLVGALHLSEDAAKLEQAGKDGDISFIRENHEALLKNYRSFLGTLAPLFESRESGGQSPEKPVADDLLMSSFYEMLYDGASSMRVSVLEDAFLEMEDYRIPDEEAALYRELKQKVELFDYEGIMKLCAARKGGRS